MAMWRRRRDPHLPIAHFLEASIIAPQSGKRGGKFFSSLASQDRSAPRLLLLFFAITLTISGVVASVAITVRGNSSTEDNVITLGVGQAKAVSCNNSTVLKTDTISQWDDNLGDFTLQRIDVTGVQSSCQNQAMTLLIDMSSGPDLNVTCSLPATGSAVYTQGTFVFATQSFSSSGSQYGCPTFSYPLYMASISAAAVQIK
jgi:hypothetical protein